MSHAISCHGSDGLTSGCSMQVELPSPHVAIGPMVTDTTEELRQKARWIAACTHPAFRIGSGAESGSCALGVVAIPYGAGEARRRRCDRRGGLGAFT